MPPKPLDVELRAIGTEGVRRQIGLVGDAADALGERAGRAGESIAGAFLQIAHHGEVSSRELKELLREGGELATMFGEGGAIVGGVAILGAALYEAFSRGNEAMEKTRSLMSELADEYRKLTEEMRGNKLGAQEFDLNKAYNDKLKEIQANAPGTFRRIFAELLAGLSSATGGAFAQASFDQYAGRQLGGDIATRTLGAERLKQEQQAQQQIAEEAKRAAEDAARKFEADQKRIWDNAVFFAANDIESNTVFAKKFAEAWKAVFDQFSLDGSVKKELRDAMKKMNADIATEISTDTTDTLRESVAYAMRSFKNLEAQGPLLGSFSTSFKKQFDEITASTQTFGETLGVLVADQIPALASGFEQAFEAIAQGENVFKALGGAAFKAIQQVASQLAIEEFAQGLAMLARSIWDFLGPNPAAGASATQHFAAAALFGTIAGGAGLAGGAAGGGGGSGSGGPTGGGIISATQAISQSKATVVFKGTKVLFDTADPESRAELIAAFKALFGDRELDFIFDG